MDTKQTVKWKSFMTLDDAIADDFCNQYYKFMKSKYLITVLILRKLYYSKILEERSLENTEDVMLTKTEDEENV